MRSPPHRFCSVCGNASLTQQMIRMDDLSKNIRPVTPEAMEEFTGIMSDMSKIANGEFKPCQCHPRAWAINQDMWWKP